MSQNNAMSAKEEKARIKINKLLEAAGWRFFDSDQGKANIALEPNVKLTQAQVDAMGNDFEATSGGFIDFLLLDVLSDRYKGLVPQCDRIRNIGSHPIQIPR